MSQFSEEELRGLGPNVRKLVEHFEKYHNPTDEEKRAMGSRIRGVGHILLRVARRVEDGDVEAIGDMLHDSEVKWLVIRWLQTQAIGSALLDAAEKLDAERN